MKRTALIFCSVLVIGTAALQSLRPQSGESSQAISAIIVPHHDIVAALRGQFFGEIGKHNVNPQTIILVSPNHYENGAADIQTTDQEWTTQYGTLQPNQSIIEDLARTGQATLSRGSFINEHGIRNIVGNIKQTFPQATVIPLILRMKTSEKEVGALNEFLTKECQDCLLVASVDFSHYQPAPLADIHDAVSIRGLKTNNRSLLTDVAETDSPSSLSLTVAWAENHGTNHFNLWKHTNSSTLAGDPTIAGTSHVFGWYEPGAVGTASQEATFSIGSVPNQAIPNDRAVWGTDLRVLMGSNQPPPQRPGEVTVTPNGLQTWQHTAVTSLAIPSALPIRLIFDTGQNTTYSTTGQVVAVVQNLERATYLAQHGAILILSPNDLGVSTIGSVPVISGTGDSSGYIASGTITSQETLVTSHLLLKSQ